jgi:hypothetical protein
MVGRMLWFLCGTAASALAISGVIIHLRRLAARDRARHRWGVMRPYGGPMGACKPVAVLVLLVGGYGMASFAAFIGSIEARKHRILPGGGGPARAAIVAVSEPEPLRTDPPLAPGSRSLVLVRLCDGCADALRSLHAGVTIGDAPCSNAELVTGERDYLHARLAIPASGASRLCLTLETWDGAVRTLSWPLDELRGGPADATAG